jgi:hypothetical protein
MQLKDFSHLDRPTARKVSQKTEESSQGLTPRQGITTRKKKTNHKDGMVCEPHRKIRESKVWPQLLPDI